MCAAGPCAPGQFARRHQPGQQANAGAFHIALAAGDLPGKADMRRAFQPQLPIEQRGRIEEGVAVQPAQPREFGLFQPGMVRKMRVCSAYFSLV
jgi:hypothetical protein